jgi:hypothetical protein
MGFGTVYLVRNWEISSFVCVRKARYKEHMKKNRGPSTPLKYVATVYFLIPLPTPSTVPLINGPKKDEGLKDEGRYVFSWYFLQLLRLTDWTLRVLKCDLQSLELAYCQAVQKCCVYKCSCNIHDHFLGL